MGSEIILRSSEKPTCGERKYQNEHKNSVYRKPCSTRCSIWTVKVFLLGTTVRFQAFLLFGQNLKLYNSDFGTFSEHQNTVEHPGRIDPNAYF